MVTRWFRPRLGQPRRWRADGGGSAGGNSPESSPEARPQRRKLGAAYPFALRVSTRVHRLLFVNQYYWPDHASTAQHLTDLAQAAELSKGCPILERGGAVEVRPIMKF